MSYNAAVVDLNIITHDNDNDSSATAGATKQKRLTRNSPGSYASVTTRNQLEQQQKLRALYSTTSQNFSPDDPATASTTPRYDGKDPAADNNNNAREKTRRRGRGGGVGSRSRSRRAKENENVNVNVNANVNANENYNYYHSMVPTPLMDSKDDIARADGGGGGGGGEVGTIANVDSTSNNGAAKSAVTPSPPTKNDNDDDDGGGAAGGETEQQSAETTETPAERASRRARYPRKDIMEPGPNDCLFGRGGGTNHHPGNKLYRKKVEENKASYLNSKRLDKPLVAMRIINEWRALDPPGRFLKQDDHTKLWNDVGDKKAREKTSQALREKTPVKQREEGGGGDHHHHHHTNRRGEYRPHHGGGGGDNGYHARFEPGTSSPGGRHLRKSGLARDHSLGETVVGGNEISLEGFSWDESADGPAAAVSGGGADVAVNGERQRGGGGGGGGGGGERRGPPPPPPPPGPGPPSYHYPRGGDDRPPPHYPPGGGDPHRQYPPHGEHPHHQYPYSREHSLENNPPLSGATVSHPAPNAFGEPPPPPPPPPPPSYYGHHYPGYGPPPPPPPPPPGHGHPPPPYHSHPHYSSPPPPGGHHHEYYAQHPHQQQQQQQRSREHSLQMNPLKGATTSQPAMDNFNEDGSHASYDSRPPPLPSPRYDRGPPPYYGYQGAPSPQQHGGWPTPPPPPPAGPPSAPPTPSPTPQFTYRPGSNPSAAFGQYDSGSRSNSIQSLGSSVDAYYDRRDSSDTARSPSGGSSSAATNVENPSAAGTSQDYSKIAELIRDTSDRTSVLERSNSWDEGKNNAGGGGGASGYEDSIQRSKSMPYEESSDAVGGSPHVRPRGKELHPTVHKPSLIRKLSGGRLARNVPPPVGILRAASGRGSSGGVVCRPEPVKRDTSNQPETPATKRSIKRVVLSRDQSAVARRLKEEQIALQTGKRPVLGNRRLSKAERLDRKLSVEINKLGLEDINENNGMPPLNRMTTEDVLYSLIDDDDLGTPSPALGGPPPAALPGPIGPGDRMTTVDVIARDIVNGNPSEESGSEWDDALNLVNEPGDIVQDASQESTGVNADIAEKWLKGET